MFKLTSLFALAGLALALPAQAQTIPSTAITIVVPGNSPCRVTPVSITAGKTPSDLRFTFNNAGSSAISFTLRLTVSGTSAGTPRSFTLPDLALTGRQTGSNAIEIGGLTTPLAALTNASARAEFLNCANASANRPLANM